MPKTHSSQPFIKWVAVAAILAVITACGGGGGNDDPPNNPTPTPSPVPTPTPSPSPTPIPTPSPSPEPDTTPEIFSFAAATEVERGAAVLSDVTTITGINTETSVMVENGEYRIGVADFTSEEGTIVSGEQITVRTTASSEFATSVGTVLTVGGVSATFTVTTEARDVSPDQFSFADQEGVNLDTATESDPVTIQGINDSTPVSIEGGDYSINGGEFTNADGVVEPGQSIVVRGTSASTVSSGVDVILTVGEEATGLITDTFTITTFADTAAPVGTIAFPPPVSMTANEGVFVRGTASDDYSGVDSITILVNGVDSGVEVESNDDFATWEASGQVPLAEGDNTISISALDSSGNQDEVTSVTVRRTRFDDAFPNEDVTYDNITGMALDLRDGQKKALSVSYIEDGSPSAITVTDLDTGLRNKIVVSGLDEVDDIYTITLDTETGIAYSQSVTTDLTKQEVISFDLDTGAVLNRLTIPVAIEGYMGSVVIDHSGNEPRLLWANPARNLVYMSDMELSELNIFSDAAATPDPVPNSENQLDEPWGLAYYRQEERLFVADTDLARVIELDALTGARTPFSVEGEANNGDTGYISNPLPSVVLDTAEGRKRLLLASRDSFIVVAVDLNSGERTILSSHDPVMILDAKLAMATDPSLGYLLVACGAVEAIFAVDLISGDRVIISKSLYRAPSD